jgi:hypothetical protein
VVDSKSTLIDDWRFFCKQLQECCQNLIERADVTTARAALEDRQSMALALLARTLSNLKAAILLLDNSQIVEARIVVRCCIENFFWMGALIKDGEVFIKKMHRDALFQIKTIDQFFHQHKLASHDELDEKSRTFARKLHKNKFKHKTFSIKEVAGNKWYSVFSMISIDAAHPSIVALRRYFAGDTSGDLRFEYNPAMGVEELDATFDYLAFACVGICIGVDELFENKIGGNMLRGVVASHSALVERVLAFQAKSTSDETD